MSELTRCQECGGRVVLITHKSPGGSGGKECVNCGAQWIKTIASGTRARKKFELIKMLMCRPVGRWANTEAGPHVSFTYPMADEAAIEADAILTELYGEMP